jgi:predicted Na+-dependent transporter
MFKKLLKFYTDYFAAWVIVFGVAAYFWPRPFKFLQQGMDWFFVLTMFGIGRLLIFLDAGDGGIKAGKDGSDGRVVD